MTAPLMTRYAIGQSDKRRSMQTARGVDNPTVNLIVKRLIAAAIIVCSGFVLSSCAGASEDGVSAFVADHWPHWAGGMPDDVPPRPGAPGYKTFIAHGQADQNASPQFASGANAAAVPAKPVVQSALPPAASAAPAAPAVQAAPQSASDDSNVVRGGLY